MDMKTRERLLATKSVPELKAAARECRVDEFDAGDTELFHHISVLQAQQQEEYYPDSDIDEGFELTILKPGMKVSILRSRDFSEEENP